MEDFKGKEPAFVSEWLKETFFTLYYDAYGRITYQQPPETNSVALLNSTAFVDLTKNSSILGGVSERNFGPGGGN